MGATREFTEKEKGKFLLHPIRPEARMPIQSPKIGILPNLIVKKIRVSGSTAYRVFKYKFAKTLKIVNCIVSDNFEM